MEPNVQIGINFIYNELRAPRADRQNLIMVYLTGVVTVATILNVYLVFVTMN